MGEPEITDHICSKLGIHPGETTEDGKFTVSLVECLGSCGTAPMMQIGFDYHEDLTTEKVIRSLRTVNNYEQWSDHSVTYTTEFGNSDVPACASDAMDPTCRGPRQKDLRTAERIVGAKCDISRMFFMKLERREWEVS